MKLVDSRAHRSQPALHTLGEKIDKHDVIVRAGDLLERFAAGAEKRVTSLLLKLFKGENFGKLVLKMEA